jgi:NAD-dependent deacetylase
MCGKLYGIEAITNSSGVPRCTCGGSIKPDVVLYEESLNDATVRGAIDSIHKADMLIIGGTSLTVYPASSFIDYFNGKYTVLINRDKTSADNVADLVIHDKIGEVLSQIEV